mmetsp:Transcript_8921/g.6689  ORF Transcript_8921/g.6689 Transcript_8921/m.6689 type:complete len:384 (+) Transcript_8921:1-1152(+)
MRHSAVAQAVRMRQCQVQAMLVSAPRRYYELQRLHVAENGQRSSYSGVRATVFGGTSALGTVIGGMLTRMGSQNIYPYRNISTIWDTRYKELKTTADLGYKAYLRLTDFTNEKEVAFSLKESNVVISCIGSHVYTKREKDFEDSNIRVPMAIAKAVKNNPKIKRFIYISAAAADPNSQSQRLRTKWIGEQEVKDIYPDVTILRPTYMFNQLHPAVTIAGKWGMQMKLFNRMNWVIEGMNANVQPVHSNDVALAILNCLKMEETIGQSYDLGGPHTYTYQELYEQFFNITLVKPYSVVVPLEDAYEYKQFKFYQSYYRQLFRTWLFPEFMTVESQNLVVNPANKSFEDLFIKPVSFGHKAHEYVADIYWLWNAFDRTKRDGQNL